MIVFGLLIALLAALFIAAFYLFVVADPGPYEGEETEVRRLLGLLPAVGVSLALAGTAAAGGGLLPRTEQPITLECADTGAVRGLAYIEARRIVLSTRVCETLEGSSQTPQEMGPAVLTLAHEFIHVSLQTRDEGVAECWGLYLTRYFLVRMFGRSPAFAQRAYNAAWEDHEIRVLRAPQYGGCAYEKVDAFTPLNR